MLIIRSDVATQRSFCCLASWVFGAFAVLSVSGCSNVGGGLSNVSRFVSPYQIDVQQGNAITREQVQALRVGMPRQQVRDILGSPLLTSVFHANRWDYAFSFKRQGQALQQRRLAVFFQGDLLARVEADELPTEAELVSSLNVRRPLDDVPTLEATDEQLKAFAERNASYKPDASSTVNRGEAPSTTYPPLESQGGFR